MASVCFHIYNKLLKFSISISLILNLSFSLHTLKQTNSTFVYRICKLLSFTRGLITCTTTVWSVLDSPNTIPRYLNPKTCSNCLPSTMNLHNNPCCYLHSLLDWLFFNIYFRKQNRMNLAILSKCGSGWNREFLIVQEKINISSYFYAIKPFQEP